MDSVFLSYNPYLLKTEIKINGEPIDPRSVLVSYLESRRLQQYLEPKKSDHWIGLLRALRDECSSKAITLAFHGTSSDYADLEQLVQADQAKPEKERCFKQIDLFHENASTAQTLDPAARLDALKGIYTKIQQGPVEAFHTDEITSAFTKAMDDSFDIVVIATTSAGKSTLINAMLWQELLPTQNQSSTSVLTRIRDDDEQEEFLVSAVDYSGKFLCKNEPATKEKIAELNYAEDTSDPDKKRSLVKEIWIRGNIPNLSSKVLHTVFIDTPGGNNQLNEQHQRVMDEAIFKEDKSLVIFVFNGTNPSTMDNQNILTKIAKAMRNEDKGKQARDRFLFVSNKQDEVNPQKGETYESMVATIKESLRKENIINPNLFMVSARTAELLRIDSAQLSVDEQDQLFYLQKKMSRSDHALYQYSSLPASRIERYNQQVKDLQNAPENQGRTDGIPEVALLNSGVPALELAIAEYLQKYAVAIKLAQAQNAFMGAVEKQHILGTVKLSLNEDSEAFEKVRADLEALHDKLDSDKTLEHTIAAIDAIQFDAEPCWTRLQSFNNDATNLYAEFRQGKEISEKEAQKKAQAMSRNAEDICKEAIDYINDYLTDGVEKECNKVMETYRQHLKTLEENGLTEIGGINVCRLSEYKAANETISLDAYITVHTESYTKRVEKSGLLSGIGRFFADLFDTDWGYSYETFERKVKLVDFDNFANDMISGIQTAMYKNLKSAVDRAEEAVQELKKSAKKQVEAVNEVINKLTNELYETTRTRDALAESVRQSESAYRFANQIIEDVGKILNID